jgi:hypothetical protein
LIHEDRRGQYQPGHERHFDRRGQQLGDFGVDQLAAGPQVQVLGGLNQDADDLLKEGEGNGAAHQHGDHADENPSAEFAKVLQKGLFPRPHNLSSGPGSGFSAGGSWSSLSSGGVSARMGTPGA